MEHSVRDQLRCLFHQPPAIEEAVTKVATPAAALTAGKDQMLAEVELVKADLAYRLAVANLASLVGKP